MFVDRPNAARGIALASVLATATLVSSVLALPGTARADNMMSVCDAEISTICSGVSNGRGRISACLYANDRDLSDACRAEVIEVTGSPTFQRYLPTGSQSAQGPEQEMGLRAACAADADRVCTGVTEGSNRFLACLYARSNSVSKACWAAAQSLLN